MISEPSVSDQRRTSYLVKRILRDYVAKHRWKVIVALICMLMVASTTAFHAYLMEPVMDDVFTAKDTNMLLTIVMLVIGAGALKAIGGFGQSYLMKFIGQRIVSDIQKQLYQHLLYSDMAMLRGEASGKLVSRFTNDAVILRGSVSNVLTGIAKDSLTLVFLIGVMFYQSIELALIAFVVFPVAIYPVVRLGKRMRKISVRTQEELGRFTEKLAETFQSAPTIKAYQQEQNQIKKANNVIERIFTQYIKAARTQSVASPMIEGLSGLAVGMVIWYGGMQVIEGGTTAGKFFSFITAALMAYKPAKTLSGLNTNLQEGLAAAWRLFETLDQKPKIRNHSKAIALKVDDGIEIALNDVHFAYNPDKPALNGLSLHAKKGQVIALVGASGGGKSTIMNLLLRYYDIDQGSILLNGQNIREITLESLRENIAYVSQDIALFDDTVRANIAYGKPDASDEAILSAAKKASADEFIALLGEGYDAQLGERGQTLSGGQRQRIAIARAIIKDAPLLLLDEATSALDTISEKKIQSALKTLMKGRTTIVIAHRLSTIEHADCIYVLSNGKVVESGTHATLLKNGSHYQKLYHGLDL